MEEVDAIILPILRECGCPLSSDISSIKQLDSSLFYTCCIITLRVINSSDSSSHKHPPTLPEGAAARMRVCSALTKEIIEKGYTDEIGYQAFLYPSEAQMRKILRFLIEKLPRKEDTEEATNSRQTSTTTRGSIIKQVNDSIFKWQTQTWTPLANKGSDYHPYHPFTTVLLDLPASNSKGDKLSYYKTYQPLISNQPHISSSFIPSLIQINSLELIHKVASQEKWQSSSSSNQTPAQRQQYISTMINSAFVQAKRAGTSTITRGDLTSFALASDGDKSASAFSRRTQFEQEKEVIVTQVVSEVGTVTSVNEAGVSAEDAERAEEEARKERESQLASLQSTINDLTSQGQQMESSVETFLSSSRQIEAELTLLIQNTTSLEEAYKVKKRTLDLLPEAQKNLNELSKVVDGSRQRLVDLAAEWETHRQPLIAKLRRGRQLLEERKEALKYKIEQIKYMREEIKGKAEELRSKDSSIKSLTEEYNSLPKSINRQVYVRRIMDIMKSLQKQKDSIKSILDDVKKVQKDINVANDSSARSFAMADEISFQTAKKQVNDELMKKAYKCIVELREGFVSLVNMIEETGKVQNEIREQQSALEDLETRNTSLNTERVENDLAAVRKENKQIMAKLKKSMKE